MKAEVHYRQCIIYSELHIEKEDIMAAAKYTADMFDAEELAALRAEFNYVDTDIKGRHRIFMDNAGGSLRLKAAEDAFKRVSEMPDASEHTNELALELLALEDRARADIKHVIFGAETGVIYPSYTASQIMMDVARIFGEHAKGSNYVTTVLEHPSSFDAMTYNAEKHGCELRVAQANPVTGGVDADAVLSLIDEDTAVLSCMAASNISGYIYDLKTICKKAREINPDIFIICDAVQHAPHAALNPEVLGVDMMHFAPYKFFGVRGFALAWLSDRVAEFDHYRLLGKAKNDWEIGSPATAQFAAVQQIIEYVVTLGKVKHPDETDRRALYEAGMKRIADHERGLLELMLEGTDEMPACGTWRVLQFRWTARICAPATSFSVLSWPTFPASRPSRSMTSAASLPLIAPQAACIPAACWMPSVCRVSSDCLRSMSTPQRTLKSFCGLRQIWSRLPGKAYSG